MTFFKYIRGCVQVHWIGHNDTGTEMIDNRLIIALSVSGGTSATNGKKVYYLRKSKFTFFKEMRDIGKEIIIPWEMEQVNTEEEEKIKLNSQIHQYNERYILFLYFIEK